MISVIIPSYNEEKNIADCLQSLLKQSVPKEEYEIIVSDSSSADNTVEVAKHYADSVFVCKKVSAGFGRNAGVKKARGSILAFIDADTIAGPKWLEGIKEGLDKKDLVGITGPVRARQDDSFFEKLFYRGWSFEIKVTTSTLGLPLLPGFNFAVKADAFRKVGGFREDDMVCEDFDLSLKLSKVGKIGFNDKMFTFTSARRLREMGVLKYSLHGLLYLLFKKKYTWADHRKDW